MTIYNELYTSERTGLINAPSPQLREREKARRRQFEYQPETGIQRGDYAARDLFLKSSIGRQQFEMCIKKYFGWIYIHNHTVVTDLGNREKLGENMKETGILNFAYNSLKLLLFSIILIIF